jgi:hypothetical protein
MQLFLYLSISIPTMRIFALSIILFICVTTFVSCKKSNTTQSGIITATINDTVYIFNYQPKTDALGDNNLLSNFLTPKVSSITMSGLLRNDSGSIGIGLINVNNNPLTIGTYTSGTNRTDTTLGFINLVIPPLRGFYSLYVSNDFTVVVDSIGDKAIKGTFSGTAYNPDNNSDTIIISSGTFYMHL